MGTGRRGRFEKTLRPVWEPVGVRGLGDVQRLRKKLGLETETGPS